MPGAFSLSEIISPEIIVGEGNNPKNQGVSSLKLLRFSNKAGVLRAVSNTVSTRGKVPCVDCAAPSAIIYLH